MRDEYAGRIFMVEAHHNILGHGPHRVYVEDYWDTLTGGSWMYGKGNPACIAYAIRCAVKGGVPKDDEVLYGHIGSRGGLGILVHVSELGEEVGG